MPKFKSRREGQSYTTYNINNNLEIDFEHKKIKLPKIKTWIRYKDNRCFASPVRHVTVRRTTAGVHLASLLVEEATSEPLKEVHEDRVEAFDMSAREFLVSRTTRMANPRFCRKQEHKLKRLHRRLSRKKKGSSNRSKVQQRLAKKYDQYCNQKNDWMHKTTRKLADSYDAIIFEDLNIQGMQKFSHGLSKSVTLDFSWYQFVATLTYKMAWAGKHLVQVGRFFPSSLLCSTCGQKNDALTLSQRKWDCLSCHTTHDRDENAAKNLRKEGMRLLQSQGIVITTVGTTGSHACGDRARPRNPVATVEEARIPLL